MPDTTGAPISVISSMATRGLLGEFSRAFQGRTGRPVALESIGGVDAARRVQAGQPFDVVVLARDAIDALAASGHLVAGTVVDLVRSPVAVAVRAGAPRPDIRDEEALRRAVLAARTIGTSTGPSGTALARLFQRWGIAGQIGDRIVTASPGVPVATLVASGRAQLGFQQLSELAGADGVEVLGPLPAAVEIVTTFSAAVCAAARQPGAGEALIAFLASPAAAETKRRHAMIPAGDDP